REHQNTRPDAAPHANLRLAPATPMVPKGTRRSKESRCPLAAEGDRGLAGPVEPPSRNVGPYRLVASLGRGGQAEVYLAIRRGPAGFSKLVVIKSIRPEMEDDPHFKDMLMSEAKLAAKLHHPNVVQTLEVG